MASGSIASGVAYNCHAFVNWSSSAGNRGSTVSATLYFHCQYRYNFTFRNGYSLTINGSTVTGNGVRVTSAGTWTLLSHSVWVGYTGNCSIGISGNANCTTVTNTTTGNKLPNYTLGATVALDKVGEPPVGAKITAPSNMYISETTDSITITWNKGSSYNGSGEYHVDVSINGGAYNWVSGSLGLNTTSWTYKIPDKTQGTTYQFRIDTGNDVGWSGHSYSGTVTVNKLSCGNMTVPTLYNPYTATQSGSNAVLPINFTAGSQNVAGTLYYKAQLYYQDKLVSSTVFTTAANGNKLDINIPPATYVSKLGATKHSDNFTVKAWLENQNGTKSSVIQSNFKVDINTDGGANPTLSPPTFSGGALNNPSTCFIENVSKITVTSGAASLRRAPSDATLKYTIKANYSEVKEGSTATFDCWQLGTYDCVVTVTDSRGLTTSVTKQYIVQMYDPPRVVITSSGRKASPNTTATITYTTYYSPIYQYPSVDKRGNQLNGISLQQYAKNSGSWVNYTSGADITGLNANYSYDFTIRVADKVKTSDYKIDRCIIPTIKSLFSLRQWGVGIGGIPQAGHALEVTGLAQFNNNLNVLGILNTQKNVQIRNGTAKTEQTMMDFGWANGSAQYTIKLTNLGSLAFETYKDGVYQARPFQLSYDGEIYCDDIQASNINALGTIRTSRIQNDGGSVGIGSTKIASNGEWLGMYDTGLNTRYFWMGRNSSTSGNFYFAGADNIKKFYFDKPIYAPTTSSSTARSVVLVENEDYNTIYCGSVVVNVPPGNTSVQWNPSGTGQLTPIAGGNGDVNAFDHPLDLRFSNNGALHICSTKGNAFGTTAIRFNYYYSKGD